MPSLDLLLYFQEDLAVQDLSYVNGVHYSQTLEAWLRKMDVQRREILPIFAVSRTASHFPSTYPSCILGNIQE